MKPPRSATKLEQQLTKLTPDYSQVWVSQETARNSRKYSSSLSLWAVLTHPRQQTGILSKTFFATTPLQAEGWGGKVALPGIREATESELGTVPTQGIPGAQPNCCLRGYTQHLLWNEKHMQKQEQSLEIRHSQEHRHQPSVWGITSRTICQCCG